MIKQESFDELSIPDKSYFREFVRWYDPHNLIIESHREVNRVAARMLDVGYTKERIYYIADMARDFLRLEPIER